MSLSASESCMFCPSHTKWLDGHHLVTKWYNAEDQGKLISAVPTICLILSKEKKEMSNMIPNVKKLIA